MRYTNNSMSLLFFNMLSIYITNFKFGAMKRTEKYKDMPKEISILINAAIILRKLSTFTHNRLVLLTWE